MILSNIHVLLDAARIDAELMDAVKALNPAHESLFRNKKGGDEVLPSVAPYLFTYSGENNFADFVMNGGWGNAWGIYADSVAGYEVLYKHFRRFLVVKTDDGESLYFRFYDPRVLRIFLGTCDKYQLEAFFGPVDRYIMEDEDPRRAVVFSLYRSELQTEYVAREQITAMLRKTLPDPAQKRSFWNSL